MSCMGWGELAGDEEPLHRGESPSLPPYKDSGKTCLSSCQLSRREMTGQRCEQRHLNTLLEKKIKNTRCNPPEGDILLLIIIIIINFSCGCKELMAGSSHGRGVLSVGLGSVAV